MSARYLTSVLLILIFFTSSSFSQSFYDINDRMVEEYQKQNYKEATRLGVLALAQAKVELGKDHPDYLIALQNLSNAYVQLEDYTNAITYSTEAFEIDESINGRFTEDHALDANDLGLYNFYESNYEVAQNWYAEAIAVYKHLNLMKSVNYFTFLENIASAYNLQDKYLQVFNIQEEILSWYINYGDTNQLNYGLALEHAAIYAQVIEKYEDAEYYYLEAIPYFNNQPEKLLSILYSLSNVFFSTNNLGSKYVVDSVLLKTSSKVNGNTSALYAIDLNRAGIGAFELEHYDEAIKFYSNALKITDENSDNYFIVEGNLTEVYVYGTQYAQGEELVERHSKNVAKKHGSNSLEYAMVMSHLASIKSKVGKYNEALKAYLIIKSIQENLLDSNHSDYITNLSNLSGILIQLNQYKQAEEFLKIVEARYKINPGPNSNEYIIVLSSLGNLYSELGNYNVAEKYYYKAVQTVYLYFPESSLAGTVFNNASGVYLKTGRYEMAIHFLREAYRIQSLIYGENSLEVSFQLISVASAQIELGDYNSAILNLTNAIDIITNITDDNNILNVGAYMNLGLAYIKQQKYTEAESSLLNAKSILEAKELTQSRNYGAVYSSLGELKIFQQQFEQALNYSLKAYDIQSKILGPIHPTVLITKFTLASTYVILKKYKEADDEFYAFNTAFKLHLNSFFPSLNEAEKAKFYHTFSTRLMAFNSYAKKQYTLNPSIASELYNNQLFTKGMLLSSVQKVRNNILSSGDSTLIALYKQWTEIKKDIILAEQQKENPKIDTDSLIIISDRIEKYLTEKSSEFAGSILNAPLNWKSIRDQLREEEVAIEIVRVTDFEFIKQSINPNKIYYIALIITPKTKNYPKMVVLQNGVELEAKFLKGNKNAINYKTNDLFSYAQYWQPIAEQIPNYANIKKIFFAPDGVYNKLSLNAFYNTISNSYLLDEVDLQISSSTRNILRVQQKNDWSLKNKKVALFGFPNYNSSLTTSDTITYNIFESLKSDNLSRFIRNGNVTALPGTKKEIEAIDKLMSTNNLESTVYTSNNASEENIKQIESPFILHIATHGFFKPSSTSKILELEESTNVYNPLEGSGLLLSGAQNTINGEVLTGENGILTAKEAMNLSLNNTELVVLSACETGLGTIKNGEGVYGLQRSFLVAGAKSVIMSLWTVDDTATQEMMTSFYTHWLSGQTKRAAFKTAQLEVRKKYSHPYYWGAFVMVGE